MTAADKPPVPDRMFDPWPRIPVDAADGAPYARIRRAAGHAAHDWALGANGPYKWPGQTLMQIVDGAVTEALLHLFELGLIDIDVQRLDDVAGIPLTRRDFRPAPESPITGTGHDMENDHG